MGLVPAREDFSVSFLYDCHVHTSEVSACGFIPGREMAELYSEANYAGIVITDHYYHGYFDPLAGSWEEKTQNYLQGFNKAYARGQELGLDVILGLELRFTGTCEDFLVYGVDEEFLLQYPRLDQLGLPKFAALAQAHDLLVVQAHPFRSGLKVAEPKYLAGVEVYNGNPRHNSRNELALDFAHKHGLIQVACSDAHRHEDVARGGIELPHRVKTSRELVDMLRKNPLLPQKP